MLVSTEKSSNKKYFRIRADPIIKLPERRKRCYCWHPSGTEMRASQPVIGKTIQNWINDDFRQRLSFGGLCFWMTPNKDNRHQAEIISNTTAQQQTWFHLSLCALDIALPVPCCRIYIRHSRNRLHPSPLQLGTAGKPMSALFVRKRWPISSKNSCLRDYFLENQ